MSKIFVVLAMIFCHILDDYTLQGWLASAKQKSWWKENAPEPMYWFDYLMALAMHSMSWAFMVMLPIAVYYGFNMGIDYLFLFIVNAFVHAVVDDAKANQKRLNLISDQIIHIIQIVMMAIIML